MKEILTYRARNQSDLHLGVLASLYDALKWLHLIELWRSSFNLVRDVFSLRAVSYRKVGDDI